MSNRNKGSRPLTVKSAEQARSYVVPILDRSLSQLSHRTGEVVTASSKGRMESNFVRMEQGSRHDDRTPIFKNVPRSQVVKGAETIVQRHQSELAITPSFPDIWFEVEEGQKANIGPMSMFVPASDDCKEKIGAVMSDKPLTTKVKGLAYAAALADVRNLLKPSSIHAVPMSEAYLGVPGDPATALDPTTNSGWPYCMSNWNASLESERLLGKGVQALRERQEMQRLINEKASALIKKAKQGARYEDLVDVFVALSFQRTVQKGPDQLKSPKSKRYVLAMPKEEIVAGKTIQIPLQKALREVVNANGVFLFPAFHPADVLDTHMQAFLSTAEDEGRIPLSGDISGYDQSLPPQVMWDVAKAMSTWMDKTTATLFLGIMYGDIYKTTVLSPVGIFKEGPSSIKSGSIFTSIGGCIWNYFIQRYGHHAGYYKIVQQCCMGDDFIIDGYGVSPDSIAECFADFGMSAHPDKQFYERGAIHFLQKTHVYGIPGGQGSFYRILGNLMSVEDDTQMRWDERNRYAYILQALQRLNNAIFNPLAEQLIQYAKYGDREEHLGANLDPDVIVKRGGSYVERKLQESTRQVWRQQQVGLVFRDWAVNRVLRGVKLPPPGVERWKMVYGKPYRPLFSHVRSAKVG